MYADKALKIKSTYFCTYRQISDVNISSVYYLSSFFKSCDHKTWHIGFENVSNGSSKDLLLYLRILTRKKTCWDVTLALKEQYEYGHLGCLYIKSTLYKRLLNWNKIWKKQQSSYPAKLHFLLKVHFPLFIPFVLTLASDMAVLYQNITFSILTLLTKKHFSRFLKMILDFMIFFFKVKVVETFKILWLSHKSKLISQTDGYFNNPWYCF